jgi:pumilio homology domain family member 6
MQFLVTKLIRLCPTHRAAILAEFQGSVIRLLLHREASGVLADAFELHANATERALLLRDFYGKELALFSGTVTHGSEADRERARKGLVGYLEGVEGDRRRRLMGAVKENLVTMSVLRRYAAAFEDAEWSLCSPRFNNPDKGAVTHAIVHRALWEYLTAANALEDAAEQEKLRREIFETCVWRPCCTACTC